jgi:hypothetical protein
MFARTTSFTGSADGIEAGIAFVRDEVMPTMTQMRGCVGISFVVDRVTGRCIATSSWETVDDMHASDQQAAPLRARGAEILGGTPVVEEWEVSLMHREHITHDGACCRVTWARTSDIDALLQRFRRDVLPRIEEAPGFCSASMLVDHAGGRLCGTSSFDSREALDASRDRMAMLREETTRMLDAEFTDVAEFELAIAHLRLPELIS